LWKNFAYQSTEEPPSAASYQKSNSICFELGHYQEFFQFYRKQYQENRLNDWSNGW